MQPNTADLEGNPTRKAHPKRQQDINPKEMFCTGDTTIIK